MGLNIGKFGTEELLYALNGEIFYLVNHLTSAVIALAGQAFGILISEVTAHGLHDFVADKVLRGD